MSLDLTKPVCTRDGRPVRILCTDRKSSNGMPIVGAVADTTETESLSVWMKDGSFIRSDYLHDRDLVQAPEPLVERWVNIYSNGTVYNAGCTHETWKAARHQGSVFSIACVKVSFRPGDGLKEEV
jgi:hypothetical protein